MDEPRPQYRLADRFQMMVYLLVYGGLCEDNDPMIWHNE